MTKLSQSQSTKLATLKARKEAYDKWLELAEHDLAVQKEAKKDEIRKLVQEAKQDGVPVRQIHLNGLGYAQVGSMEKFLQPKVERQSARIDRLLQPVEVTTGSSAEPVFTPVKSDTLHVWDNGKNQWLVEDEDGDEWIATIMHDNGEYVILNAPSLEVAGPGVKHALVNFKPQQVWWGVDELKNAVNG